MDLRLDHAAAPGDLVNTALLELLSQAHDVKLVIDGNAISLTVERPSPSASEASAGTGTPNLFRFEDGKWNIRYNGRAISRKRSVALTYIHELLKIPHGTISATELLAKHYGDSPQTKSKEQFSDEGYSELHLAAQSHFAEPILPDDKRQRLQISLRELKDDLAQLQAAGEDALAFEKKQEIDGVEDHLRQSKFGTHAARFNGRADRDRKSVSLAIARAIGDIAKDHPALARHLDNSIRTGWQCSYAPEMDIKWLL